MLGALKTGKKSTKVHWREKIKESIKTEVTFLVILKGELQTLLSEEGQVSSREKKTSKHKVSVHHIHKDFTIAQA